MTDSNMIVLDKCLKMFNLLLDNGQFFQSAIEFDPFSSIIDGEQVEEDIKALVVEITTIINDQNTKR